MLKILSVVKKEAVFFAALTCALISMLFVKPSAAYLTYIDWNTLFMLFALMGVVAAFRSCGIFERAGLFICSKFSSIRAISFVLVMLCFFSSMLITNDVALLTFVPLTLELLGPAGHPLILMFTVILQTLAANTGSMLTPLGNPQNLFLYGKMGLPVFTFISIILPYTVVSLVCLSLCMFFIPSGAKVPLLKSSFSARGTRFTSLLYGALFILCLLAVVHIIPKWLCALLVFLALLFTDKKILARIDYMLLLTFAAFFIFTGNIAAIKPVKDFLLGAVKGNEYVSALLSSQIISNVPAALLLYPFSLGGLKDLLVGVNVGGLGTLVASLASLISFKIYASEKKRLNLPSSAKYLLVFSCLNVLFLFILTGCKYLGASLIH